MHSGERDLWEVVERDCLLLALEQSIRVRARAHFFSWTQGALQSLLPHDVLFCAAYNAHGEIVASEIFCPMPLDPQSVEEIARPGDGLLRRLLNAWNRAGRLPLLIDFERADKDPQSQWRQVLTQLDFENLVAHGSWGPTGTVDTFFGFARVRKPLDTRFGQLVELIVPHLHSALVRIQPGKAAGPRVRNRALTSRETEILRLMQLGRSNSEIGAALSISPLTVKNHVQNVLRKLGARNRTQAVAVGLSLEQLREG